MRNKTVFAYIRDLPAEERARFCGSACVGVMKMEQGSVKDAAKLEALCPAALAEKVLGAPGSCEAMSRSAANCRACTERFLRMEMPKPGVPGEADWNEPQLWGPDGAFLD